MTSTTVYIEPIALADTLLAIHQNPVEISGLIKAKKISEAEYIIKGEPLIIEQECSAEHTDFTIPYGHWTQKMMREQRDTEIKEFRVWFHSHAHFDAYFSDTDRATIENWNGTLDEWWISWVLNKRGQQEMRLDIFKPERHKESIREIKLQPNAGKEWIRRLMVERAQRMEEIIKQKIKINDPLRFERLLRGIFGG